jgi:hypothetical protein
MGYDVELIEPGECDKYREKYGDAFLFSSKVDISGICVELFTSDRDHVDMWGDNFHHMSGHTRSHARLFCINDPEEPMRVLFEPYANTAFLFNFGYYGWVKSIALGVAGCILEEAHRTYSVHGAALDIDGVGVTLIAPSKVGKTTQSWGLLRAKNTHLISDDWYFVNLGNGRPIASGSEKNCYIDADIGDVWEEYKPLVQNVKFDSNNRGIANIRWVSGESSVMAATAVRYIILMKRDANDDVVHRAMGPEEALEYLMENDLCNPHQIVSSERKMKIREAFLRKFLWSCETHMINTIKSPEETQNVIRQIIGLQESR